MKILIELESETEPGNKIVIDTDETTDPELFLTLSNETMNKEGVIALTTEQVFQLAVALLNWLKE